MARLALQHVVKNFGAVTAIDDVSFDVEHGEFICLLGPSGCGKSTLLRIIAGFEEPGAGDISIDGASVTALAPNERPTGMVFQSHALWPHMNVFRNIAFGLKLRRMGSDDIRRKVREALELVGLVDMDARYPHELSGGQQQRVAIARCLVLEPKILLMDEPFSALDAHLRVRLRDEIHGIQRRLGITTIFVTHDQEEALTLADRIVVMNAGKVEQMGRPSEIYDHPGTAFVAGFLGTMNLVEGRVDQGLFTAGPIRLAAPAPDGAATLAIRAEDMTPAASPDAASIRGTVQRLIDLGAFRMLQLDIGTGEPLRVRLPKGRDLKEGDLLHLSPRIATLFRDGAAPLDLSLTPDAPPHG